MCDRQLMGKAWVVLYLLILFFLLRSGTLYWKYYYQVS